MPLWFIILGGIGLYLFLSNNASSAASSGALLPTATGGSDDIPTPQSAVPPPLQVGQVVQLAGGTKLFSDSKLSNATSTVVTSGGGSLSVTVTATGIATDGSISASYTDASGNTYWFQQPNT